jgi:hypothetical protein
VAKSQSVLFKWLNNNLVAAHNVTLYLAKKG